VPANGFRLGSQGGSYGGVCPSDIESEFTTAYQSGRQLYTLQARVSNVTHQIKTKRNDLHTAESDIVSRSALAISSEATVEERAQAVLDVKHLGERVGRLKSEIRQLEEDRVHCERDLEDYRASLQLSP
jgi:predicted  nucleic acid-binding Zn-ribbon protein